MSNNPSSSSWKNVSSTAAHLQKYGLRPLTDEFVPTEEEKALLEMYEIVRSTERVAARLKEEAARNKLNARNEEYNKSLNETKKKRIKRKEAKKKKVPKVSDNQDGDEEVDDDELDDDDDDDENDGSSEEDEEDMAERREARLEKMREEVEEAKLQQMQQDTKAAQLRAEHLSTTTDVADGPSIRRKRNMDMVNEPTSSLIANITAAVTPPHDFSKNLELTDNGKVLLPVDADEFSWSPPEGVFAPNDGAFVTELDGFDVARAQAGMGNNTLAIKFMTPIESKRFSFNIAGPDHNDFDSILFHFNPRQREKGGQLVVNDKQEGSWGQAVAIPLSQLPLMFGQTSCTLIIQITGDGFDIFLEGKHCARLEHRKELPSGKFDLVLQFPSTDDYGSPENWIVYKVRDEF
jgi:Galactoside-binding lectin